MYLLLIFIIAAVQMWGLATHLPLIIGNIVPSENDRWNLFLNLLQITSLCFAPVISKDQVAYLQILINDHHQKFKDLYPQCSIIPKMHFMVHTPTAIIRYIWKLPFVLYNYLKGVDSRFFTAGPPYVMFTFFASICFISSWLQIFNWIPCTVKMDCQVVFSSRTPKTLDCQAIENATVDSL